MTNQVLVVGDLREDLEGWSRLHLSQLSDVHLCFNVEDF